MAKETITTAEGVTTRELTEDELAAATLAVLNEQSNYTVDLQIMESLLAREIVSEDGSKTTSISAIAVEIESACEKLADKGLVYFDTRDRSASISPEGMSAIAEPQSSAGS